MDKEVILGALESRLKKDSNEFWYRVNYLEISSGRVYQDYFDNPEDYKKLLNKNIPIGTRGKGVFGVNSHRNVVLIDFIK